MHALSSLIVILAPLGSLAAPAGDPAASVLGARQPLPQPPPCVRMTPEPSPTETEARFDAFANAFLVTKNITEAFLYITEDYINHNPFANNGAKAAWDILSPIWGRQSITVLRTKFEGDQGWLNYRSGFGTIVDRFRWEGGCIAEHWDAGEVFPEN
ncbi:hypothetical protein DL764_000755 [Monosporascus ibericus]|uniref:SnoaL-like domain-containing protein n=1 Tax=Monosporascus ibericus TaxID=155417 RepID=A0A4Q4TXC0_9PEZI|nr:hypothetical protein DL764_000755 [Monosporascus ibericus]